MHGGRFLALLLLLGLFSLVLGQDLPFINQNNPCLSRALLPAYGESTDRGTYWAYFEDGATADQPTIDKVQRLAQKFQVREQEWHLQSFTVAVSGVDGICTLPITNGFFDFYQPNTTTNPTVPVSDAFSTYHRFNTSCQGGGLYYTGVAITAYPSNDAFVYRCNLTQEILLAANSTLFFALVLGDGYQPYRPLAFSSNLTQSNTLAAYRGSGMSPMLGAVKRPFSDIDVPAPLDTWTTDTNISFDHNLRQLCIGFQGILGSGQQQNGSTEPPPHCKRDVEWLEKRHEELLKLQRDMENSASFSFSDCNYSAQLIRAGIALALACLLNVIVCIAFCRTAPRRPEELQ